MLSGRGVGQHYYNNCCASATRSLSAITKGKPAVRRGTDRVRTEHRAWSPHLLELSFKRNHPVCSTTLKGPKTMSFGLVMGVLVPPEQIRSAPDGLSKRSRACYDFILTSPPLSYTAPVGDGSSQYLLQLYAWN